MSKHYIRIDEENKIIYGFSSDFEKPLPTDICINENGGRQFELLGEVNPNLLNENGCHRFRYTNIKEVDVVEDATSEVVVTEDTSGVKMDDPDAVLESVDVNVTATAIGKKNVVVDYYIRYSTDKELEEEKNSTATPDISPSTDEQIANLQSQVEMLTDCLLEMSEIVYGM